MEYVDSDATFSKCGTYRYKLWRDWRTAALVRRIAVFWLCNPSTADAKHDDPTVRRCVGFAKRWNCTGVVIGNVHAYRASNPRDLVAANRRGIDTIGPQNTEYLARIVDERPFIIVGGWGRHARWVQDHELHIAGQLYRDGSLHALALNQDGSPRHPLYCPYQDSPPLSIGALRGDHESTREA